MSARGGPRVQGCSAADARQRLLQAQRFLEVANLVADESREDGSPGYSNVTATLAVLAGIAACDAACCRALGKRSRGDDHRQAVDLVATIDPRGKEAARALRRLLAMKNDARYGLDDLGRDSLRKATRQAQALVSFAETVVRA